MRQNLDLPKPLDGNLWLYRNLGRAHAMHHHAELEFNLVTQGNGMYLLENRKYKIHRGDLLWLFPAQEHVLVDQSADFEMWIGVFKPKTVRRIASEEPAKILRQTNPAGEYCRRLAQRDLTWLEELFSKIVAMEKPVPQFNLELSYALLSAWQHFERAANVPIQDVHPAVEKAARLIRHEKEALKLDAIAQKSGLSPHRLSRLFKQQTGVALVDFRNRQRVERFLEIYGTGQRRTMLDAALEAGFGSYPQFHRVFKHVTGRTPAEHRRHETTP